MKIAVLIHELLIEGGGERQCLSLARALSRQGHEVNVFTCAYEAERCFPEICRDLNIQAVGRGWWPTLRSPRFIRGYLDMVKLTASVTHRHQIWNPHHWPAQWAAVWLKRRLGGTVLWMCNDVPTFPEKTRQRGSLKTRASSLVHRAYYWYDRKQNRQVDLTLLLSRWAEKEFSAVYPGPTRVVRSGADPERFALGGNRLRIRERFGYNGNDFVFLWLGIFMPHRRLQDAVEAVSLLASRGMTVKLLLAGATNQFPEYYAFLEALVKQRGLENQVTFAGKVADDEICDFYCACDAFLFPNDQQTWGLAVLEAMACGKPVLVSMGSGVHEIMTDNENAFLFPPKDPQSLAEKIEIVISQSDLRKSVAENGMRLARETYTWSHFADQISAIASEFAVREHPPELATLRSEMMAPKANAN
ncbi:MAG: glycosyltransferase family 4 protein [Terriglobales bacterium]